MNNTASTTKNSVENIENTARQGFKDTLDAATHAASAVTKEVQRGASEIGSAVKELSSDAVKNLEERGVEALDAATKAFNCATEKLEADIKKSPYVALGIAFGLGVLAACAIKK